MCNVILLIDKSFMVTVFSCLRDGHVLLQTARCISGPLVDIMGGTIFITARSIMAKIVGPDELGILVMVYFLLIKTIISTLLLISKRTSDGYLWYRRIARSDRVRSSVYRNLQEHSEHVSRSVQLNWINFGYPGYRYIFVSIYNS